MKIVSIGLRIAVAVGLVAYLFYHVDMAGIYERALGSNPYFLLTGTLVLALQPILGAVRWNVILSALERPVSLIKTLRWTYVSVLFGQILPATVGADAIRIWLAGRGDVGWHDSVVSVLLERIAMLTVLAVLLLFGLPYIGKMLSVPWVGWSLVLFLLGGLAGIVFLFFGNRIPERLDRHRAVRAFRYLAEGTRRFVRRPMALTFTIVLCGLSYLDLMASVFLYAQAFGAHSNPMQIVVLLPPVLVASMLPVSLGGWGTRELAMVTALGLVNISANAALLASLWLGISSILIALPGAVFFMMQRIDLQASQSADILAEGKEV